MITRELNISSNATFSEISSLSPTDIYYLPTISKSQTHDLKVDTGLFRVWQSRMTHRDYDDTPEGNKMFNDERRITEKFINGRWVRVNRYGLTEN